MSFQADKDDNREKLLIDAGDCCVSSSEDIGHVPVINERINNLVQEAWRLRRHDLSRIGYFLKVAKWQKEAAHRREDWRQRDVPVPPFMIFSATDRCNLNCSGCYARELHNHARTELTGDQIKSLLAEASELGISFILIGGGEPLTRPEIIGMAASFPRIIFPLFTNGLLIDDLILNQLSNAPNIIPVLSLEGSTEQTDRRRGAGTFQKIIRRTKQLQEKKIFFGFSLTVTRSNLDTVTDRVFVEEMIGTGCRVLFYVEYVPVENGTEEDELTQVERSELTERLSALRLDYPALFVAFPGDESKLGGCLSAGRGFVHVNAAGDIEPCPFAPGSDANLVKDSLQNGLRSPLLRKIRDNHERLTETDHGCALWRERDWLHELVSGATTDKQ